MKVTKTIKRDEGTYEVNTEFSEEEFDSIIEIGLNVLLAHGALPFQATEDDDDVFIVAAPSTLEH